ncbi:MAG: hypothetical protein QM682_14840 [Paracoccus sp. (in: a-proteobacteria)]|uniref:hypothetical protein n=1 Tax=Paracoccus sp. TaxID=267 RepID=UPI0039E429F8
MTAPRPSVTSLELLPVYGQSENRSSDSPALAATLDAATPGQIYYISGMATEAGRPVDASGAGWSGTGMAAIDLTKAASGFLPAANLGRVSPAYTFQYCRSARWADAGQPQKGAVIGDHGYGGRYIAEWRRIDASPIGRNQQYWMRESKRLADEFGVAMTCPYVYLFQGSSAKDQAGAVYRADFDTAHGETVALATELFGRAPKLIVVVNGADVNTVGDVYDTPGMQYRIAQDYGGIIAGWQRIYPINDQNAHIDPDVKVLIGETCDWAVAEIEAGRPWNITYAVEKSDNIVTVSFALRPGETLTERADLYAAYGAAATCTNFGFESDVAISSVVPDMGGNSVTITLASASPKWLRFAHQVQDCFALTDEAGYTMSAHRTTLFPSHIRASHFLPGRTLWRALPGFRGSFQDDIFVPQF